jgi:UDP-2,3-diacylglucosamine pyrophosphatase LpxH
MIPAGQIFVIGDSHIGLSDGSEKGILQWLDRLVALQPRALYLNGDLFHYLIAHPKFYTSSVNKLFARLRELRDSGIEVHYVEGNRDFFIKGSFAEKAVSDVALQYAIEAGGRKYLITHGDLINDRDYQYRFWRFLSKSGFARFGLRFIPRGLARRFVDGVEQRLSRSNFKYKSRLPLETMEVFGRERARDGFTHIVLGHFHEKLVLPTAGLTVTILPPWFESGEAMVIDPETGDFSFLEI